MFCQDMREAECRFTQESIAFWLLLVEDYTSGVCGNIKHQGRVDLRWCYQSHSVLIRNPVRLGVPTAMTRELNRSKRQRGWMSLVDLLLHEGSLGCLNHTHSIKQFSIILLPDLYQWQLTWGSLLANITLMINIKREQEDKYQEDQLLSTILRSILSFLIG